MLSVIPRKYRHAAIALAYLVVLLFVYLFLSYSTIHHAVLDLALIVLNDARSATMFTGGGQ
jgi:hypothetical protein